MLVVAPVGTTPGAVDPVPSSPRSPASAAPGCTSTPRGPASPRCARSSGGSTTASSWRRLYATNPHKWLLTNFDCDAFWVADRAALIGALSILPEYLRNAASESGAVIDYRDWHVPLGRRFRALKLWFVLRRYGAEGLRAHIRAGVELAQQFAPWWLPTTGSNWSHRTRSRSSPSGCARATRPPWR